MENKPANVFEKIGADLDFEREMKYADKGRCERVKIDNQRNPFLRNDGVVEASFTSDGEIVDLSLQTKDIGPKNGRPFLWFHGTPHSLDSINPRRDWLERYGIRLIVIVRPGYDDSTPHPGRIVADGASYAEAVAAAYGLDAFFVAGRSGGGPYALACAALLSEKVLGICTFSSIASLDGEVDLFKDGAASNQTAYSATDRKKRKELWDRYVVQAADEYGVIDGILEAASLADRWAVYEMEVGDKLSQSFRSAHHIGRFEDVMAAQSYWGFELTEIDDTMPAYFFQGGLDEFTTVAHFHELCKKVPHAVKDFDSNAGHLSSYGKTARILARAAFFASERRKLSMVQSERH